MKLLEGKVVVVTGAGGGLGRCHALALAAEGAKVVVNDLGGKRDGSGASSSMADAVVAEIRKAGGDALANYDNVVTGADRIIASAVEKWGRIDVLVNNAGILRDKTVLKMSDEEFDLVMAVHARGTWACTRAAARVMAEKATGGRIINTTSAAGLKGNFGQSNYSAAKAAIYGLTATCAMEFGKHGITVNAIAPLAKTRMTEDIDMISAEMRPEDVSPVVVWLASDLSKDVTGRIIGVHGRHLFEYRMEVTEGVEKADAWTPSEIASRLSEIAGSGSTRPSGSLTTGAPAGGSAIEQYFALLPGGFDAERAKDWKSVMHWAVTGAGDWTVEVAEKKVKVAAGKPASPTCTVTVDSASMNAMIEGKLDPQMAFLNGKIKATRLDDLGKFGKVFDFKKMKALAGQPASAPAAPKPVTSIAAKATAAPTMVRPVVDPKSLFESLPGRFLPEKAAGFNGVVQLKVDAFEGWVEIRDGKCSAKAGAHPAPTGTLTMDAATFSSVLEGVLDPSKAPVKTTHPPSWLKFRQCFKFEPMKGIHRALVGRTYAAPAILIRPERIALYDETVGHPGSPVFPVILVKELFLACLNDPDFNGDVSRLVHAGQSFVFHQPLRAWDLVSPRGRALTVESKASGELVTFGQRLYREGELVVEMESTIFFRGESKGEKKAEAPAPERGKPASTATVVVPADLSRRYAKVSGDDNPIHTDIEFAKMVGFKDVILHGLATLALAARTLPKDLARLSVRFSKPVYPGDRLTTSVWGSGATLTFETVNQDGEKVLTDGAAVARMV